MNRLQYLKKAQDPDKAIVEKTYSLSATLFSDMNEDNVKKLEKQAYALLKVIHPDDRDDLEEAWEEASDAIMDAIKALAKFEAEVEKFM